MESVKQIVAKAAVASNILNDLIIIKLEKKYIDDEMMDKIYERVVADFCERFTIYHKPFEIDENKTFIAVFPLSEFGWAVEQLKLLLEETHWEFYHVHLFVPLLNANFHVCDLADFTFVLVPTEIVDGKETKEYITGLFESASISIDMLKTIG